MRYLLNDFSFKTNGLNKLMFLFEAFKQIFLCKRILSNLYSLNNKAKANFFIIARDLNNY